MIQQLHYNLDWMSLYNGFISHEQQSKYYTLIQYLVMALQKRLLKFYNNEQVNQIKFVKILTSINRKITKMEQSKYQQPKFATVLNALLQKIYPQYLQQNYRKSNLSNISSSFNVFHANNSRISFNFSVDQLPEAENIRSTSLEYKGQASVHKTYPLKYRSLVSIKKDSVLGQQSKKQTNSYAQSQSSLKSKINQFKSMRMKIHPPKIGDYIQKIQEQSNLIMKKDRKTAEKLKTVDQFMPYMGQRRKKVKKVHRTIGLDK